MRRLTVQKCWRGVICLIISSLISSINANENFYIVLENRCQADISINIKQHADHVSKYKRYTVGTLSSKTIGMFEAEPYHLWIRIHKHWRQLHLQPHHRYIGADWLSVIGVALQPKSYVSWHWWNPFPSFTLLFCPEAIDLDNNKLFDSVDKVLFLGDSLSDKGTLHKFTLGSLPKSPPYYNGAFSNGRPWTVRLAEDLQMHDIAAENYAVGGASARWHLWHGLPYSFDFEIDTYLFNNEPSIRNRHIAFVLVGANDYPMQQYTDKQIKEITIETINIINAGLDRLLRAGVTRFVILGLPDLGLTPKARQLHITQSMSAVTKEHNRQLVSMIERYRAQHATSDYQFHHIDIFDMLSELVSDQSQINARYGLAIENLMEPCWNGNYSTYSTESVINGGVTVATTEICAYPEHHLFWDEMHPTQTAHDLLYRYIREKLGIKAHTTRDEIEVC
ncbi:hypothetical protein GCM10010995_08070 [Cysteiniphilum litorale]|uniref:Uncharacterized protein n=2 Tax=Cysteiniphilum litorale TaxID=2056700 RepID=A0A8J3E892_9GAMM|nr:hypothetical protein GCM10010995_08070 [Cysteiniphilum litorale]